MPSTNGHGPKTAVLYARVSTDEQARSGYSLNQQLEALREYASREGYEVLEEVSDPGQSGASLERPGMDRVRDLVQEGGVSVVLAQDRDRFSREPAYTYLLRREFEEHGTKLKALNDHGDDSPEGQLTDGIMDQLARYERAKTARRSRNGKLQKARQGKIVGGHRPHYGFRYNERRDAYLVDEDEMPVVRRIFEMIGVEGRSIRAVRRALASEGVPTPGGGRYWSQMTVRALILDDVYKPHTREEIQALVSPEVADRLDPEERYGVYWYNTRKNTYRQVAEVGPDGKRRYRKRRKVTQRPREEWIGVPVPNSGIPREWVDLAREAVESNRAEPSRSYRFWELSGGMLRCSECGSKMRGRYSTGRGGPEPRYFYYRCARQWDNGSCSHNKQHRAEEVEGLVWALMHDLLAEPNEILEALEEAIEAERKALSRGNPEAEAKAWLDRIAEADRKRDGYLDLAADGILPREELLEKLSALEQMRTTAETELSKIEDRTETLRRLERDLEAMKERYAQSPSETFDSATPEDRHHLYGACGLQAIIHPDGTVEISTAILPDLPEEEGVLCGTAMRSSTP